MANFRISEASARGIRSVYVNDFPMGRIANAPDGNTYVSQRLLNHLLWPAEMATFEDDESAMNAVEDRLRELALDGVPYTERVLMGVL